MPAAELVRFSLNGRVARVTLDRPPLHILDLPTLAALDAVLDRVDQTPEAVVAVIDATGGKAFSSGVDIAAHTPEKVEEMPAPAPATATFCPPATPPTSHRAPASFRWP
jgi:enoyl-CoA hydratase/carnithine racemase